MFWDILARRRQADFVAREVCAELQKGRLAIESLRDKPESAKTDASGSSSQLWSAISALAACIATLLAVWATWEARESAVQSKQAIRASVWMQMLNDYAAPEMLSAMKELRTWQSARPNDFDKAFVALLLKQSKSTDEQQQEDRLDSARRRVGQFFNKLRVLCKIHVIDERDVGLTWTKGTYTFVSQVLAPFENAKSEALFSQHSITPDDKREADALQEETLQFYRRVFAAKTP